MNKSYLCSEDNSGVKTVSDEDMALINSYSQTKLSADEVFCFSAVLCDNEIDRDFERFGVDAIKELAKLFKGKTAIKNHSMNTEDQSARTYKTEVVTDSNKLNSLGEPYTYLKAYCYMPVIPKNEDLIAEIKAGIKKEVSIGCSVKSSICSVCGKDVRVSPCPHTRGRKYKGRLCYNELCEPTDAYEWSFVAVPAQKNAGVVKHFRPDKEENMKDIFKTISECTDSVTLTVDEAHRIVGEIKKLSLMAKDGEIYRASLEKETVKNFALFMPSLSNDCTESICKALSTEDLKALNSALEGARKTVSAPQTAVLEAEKNTDNSQFRF